MHRLEKYLSHPSLMSFLQDVRLGDEHPRHSQKGDQQQKHLFDNSNGFSLHCLNG